MGAGSRVHGKSNACWPQQPLLLPLSCARLARLVPALLPVLWRFPLFHGCFPFDSPRPPEGGS